MNDRLGKEALLVACLCATWCKTCAVFRGEKPLFYGVTMPQEGVVARTLASLARDDRDPVTVPEEIAGLPVALGSRF